MKIQNFKSTVSPFAGISLVNFHFNINEKLNRLNIKSLKQTKQLKSGNYYDFDYDNQINANNK